MAAPVDPPTFDRGRYGNLRVLSRGGFGAVYDALDNQSGERVALKILTLTDTHREVAEEMVKREVGALEGFQHPAVARLLRHFEERDAGRMGIVLALVPGGLSLESLLRDVEAGREELRPLRWRLEQLSQILDALDRAHQRRVIHRDVKPANVLLDREELTLKLADFGVALVLESFGRGESGRTLREFYTRPYAAPEQVLRQMATPASDLHAFGVLAACLLAGRLPGTDFPPESVRAFLVPAQQLIPDAAVFDRIATTIAQLVHADAALRPKAAEVGRVLREVIERTTQRQAVSLKLTRTAEDKARRAGLRDLKAIRQDLNTDLRVRYDPDRSEGKDGVGFTLRLWGRTLFAVAKPIELGSTRLVLVDAGANAPSVHQRQRENQLHAPFTVFLGQSEDANELIRFAYEDHASKRADEEARALEESLFKLSETVLEQERRRLEEILVRYELDIAVSAREGGAERPSSANGPVPANKVPEELLTKTGQLLRLRVVDVTIPIDMRGGPTEVAADWYDDLVVEDDRFYFDERELGTFYAFHPDTKTLVLRVTKPLRLPGRGLILHKDLGTERALERQEDALAVFKRGSAVNPNLRRLLLFPEENGLGERRPRELLQVLEPREDIRDIVERAAAADDFFLIQGPPGTGKTTVIAEVMGQLLLERLDTRILLSSQANEAVDNAIEALRELAQRHGPEWRIVRYYGDRKDEEGLGFGAAFRVWATGVQAKSSQALESLEGAVGAVDLELVRQAVAEWQTKLTTYHDVREDFASTVHVFGLTCIKVPALTKLVSDLSFDRVIVDEAAKAMPSEVLVPLTLGRKLVLVGDHRQLPPYLDQTTEEELRAGGIDVKAARVSLFEGIFDRLPSTNRATLTRQFRMHRSIGSFVSDLFYSDINERRGLEHGTPDAERSLELQTFGRDDRVFWIDVRGRERPHDTSWWNQEEVEAVGKILEKMERELAARGAEGRPELRYTCGVIAGYVAQRERLRDRVVPKTKQWRHLELTDRQGRPQVATVDAFQGKQRDIVVYSMVRVSDSMGWVSDPRRLNVAFSRARRLLLIVGSAEAAARSQGLAQVLNRVAKSNILSVEQVLP